MKTKLLEIYHRGRADRIAQVREEIVGGRYETSAKLSMAARRLLADLEAEDEVATDQNERANDWRELGGNG